MDLWSSFIQWIITNYVLLYYYLCWCSDCLMFGQWKFLKLILSFWFNSIILWGLSRLTLIFPAPDLEPIISPKALVIFSIERYLETKTWVPHVLITTGVSLLLGPLGRQRWNAHMHPHTHTSVSIRWKPCIQTDTFQSNTTGFASVVALFIVVILFSNSEKPVSHYSQDN